MHAQQNKPAHFWDFNGFHERFQDFNGDSPDFTKDFGDFTDFTKDFRISTKISGFRERFQISREISGKVYEISGSGGPLELAFVKEHVARPSPSISGVSMRGPRPALFFSSRPIDPTPRIYCTSSRCSPLSLCLLHYIAAQRNGENRMCSPVYLLMLPVCGKLALLIGIHSVGPCPIE